MAMATLGLFVFDLAHAPYQQLQRETNYRHPSTPRIGKMPARQFLGPGDDKITLSGTIYPEISSGGKVSIDVLRGMAAEGKAWPLLYGTGEVVGMFVLETVSETSSLFFPDGSARKIDFSLSLTHVDDENHDLSNVVGTPSRSMLESIGAAMAAKPAGAGGGDGMALYGTQTS